MTARAQIRVVTAELAARLKLDSRQIGRYCRQAARAGYSTRLDQLTTVFLAKHAPLGERGPDAADPTTAAIFRDSPRRSDDAAARLRAEIARSGGWREQVDGAEFPRDARAFAQWCVNREAERQFPGDAPAAARQRAACRARIESGQGGLLV